MPCSVMYSYEELEMIRHGICPPGRLRKYALEKARELGCRDAWTLKTAAPWTEEEIELLRRGLFPLGRSKHAAWSKSQKLGIKFHPNGTADKRGECARARKFHDAIVEEVRRTGKIRDTARKFGVSYTCVSEYAKAAGLTYNPSPAERRGDSIRWGGCTWVWHVGKPGRSQSYWRETSGRRRNLARVIYELEKGPIPPGYCVVIVNGDRMDLRPGNLEAVSRQEFCRRQQQDPATLAAILAGGALGRLTRAMRDELDPSRKAAAAQKMKATKIEKGIYHGN